MKLTVLIVLVANMLGNAPDAAFTDKIDIKAMIFEDASWRFTCLVGGHEDLFEFFGEGNAGIGDAVDVGVLAKQLLLFLCENLSAHDNPPRIMIMIPQMKAGV